MLRQLVLSGCLFALIGGAFSARIQAQDVREVAEEVVTEHEEGKPHEWITKWSNGFKVEEGKTFKLKFGHRGVNQPVLDLETGKVEITTQNHGFAVEDESLPDSLEVTHRNLNDDTIAGLRHRDEPAFGVQYHPEAASGPHDSHYLFNRFQEQLGAAAV